MDDNPEQDSPENAEISPAAPSKKRIAIITGASSGMGREFARRIDARFDDVDEFWLVARRQEALEEVAKELSRPARAIPADLTQKEAIDDIGQLLNDEQPWATYLVNAAGFCKFGDWRTVSEADTDSMVELDCRAVSSLTKCVLPYMQRGSHIIQVASCAAFMPLPHMNIYAASKAYVLRYTRALRWELHFTGITATALCPFWVKTGFEKNARKSEGGQDVRHLAPAQKPEVVVRRALRANRMHAAVVCAGIIAFLLRILGQILPNCITIPFWELIRRL